MKYIGAHFSASGGVQNAPLNAMKAEAKALALFTKNQRQWSAKPYDKDTIEKFKRNLTESKIKPDFVLPHDSYLINIGNPIKEKREQSLKSLLDEAKRVEQLGLYLLNFHPGNHLNQYSEEECMGIIAQGMNYIIEETEKVILVMETTAGTGSSVGYKFEHLAYIIDKIKNKNRVGICIDTCHIFAAGYDIRTRETYEETMKQFDKIVGFDYLKGMHLNDSKMPFGSHKDRHHSLGKGEIGIDAFKFIMEDKRLDNIPLILETVDKSLWPQEIKMLYGFCK